MNNFTAFATAYIEYLKRNYRGNLRECDYSKSLALILPQCFPLNLGWFITPEFALTGDYSPDYLIGRIITTPGPYYGTSYHHVVVEVKRRIAVSWWVLMRNQLWDECDAVKNGDGKIFCIALIGFEICFFTFDVNDFHSPSGDYRSFDPLNLNHFTEKDLNDLDVEYIPEKREDGVSVIRVIRWRIDDPRHRPYIVDMLQYISTNNP